MLWITSWSSSKKGYQVLQESLLWQVLATHFMSVRYEVAETTLYQWKMKITFPSIIAFFCITGKVHPKWKFAVIYSPSGHLKCRWLDPWSFIKWKWRGSITLRVKKSRYRKHKLIPLALVNILRSYEGKTMSTWTVHWHHYL